jgi:hypothetical protein
VINGGNTVRSLSASFLADLEEDWRAHGKKIFPILREKFFQAYFNGLVALSRIIRWEDYSENMFDRTLTPDQIMDRLEERVGPEGRKLFEQFIRKVNILQAKQQLEAQAQMGGASPPTSASYPTCSAGGHRWKSSVESTVPRPPSYRTR